MEMMKQEFRNMRSLKKMFGGDIYEGIFYILHDSEYYTRDKKYLRIAREVEKSRYNYLDIYGRLYDFHVDTESGYIECEEIVDLDVIVADFVGFLPKYYWKIREELLVLIIRYNTEMSRDEGVLKLIFDLGFNVNYEMEIRGEQITILEYFIDERYWHGIDLVLDRKPKLFNFGRSSRKGESIDEELRNLLSCTHLDGTVTKVWKKYQKLRKKQYQPPDPMWL
jgi:hypothetical protein